jgi:hypothetical protein
MTNLIRAVTRFWEAAAASWSELFMAENQRLFPRRAERPLFRGTKFCRLTREALSKKSGAR